MGRHSGVNAIRGGSRRKSVTARYLAGVSALLASAAVLTPVSPAYAADGAATDGSDCSESAGAPADDSQLSSESFETQIGQRAVMAAMDLSGCTGWQGVEALPCASSPAPVGLPVTDKSTVPPALFGMHIHQLVDGPVKTGANAIRLWDTGVTWRELQPEPGPINWEKLDKVVANAQAGGATEIQYVLGSTPEWAASTLNNKGEVRGSGSASYPKSDGAYLNFARQVVQRYKGKITSYQVWNESDLPDFYAGPPGKLADLTAQTYKLVKCLDPGALVASAGLVPREGRYGPDSFEDKYLAGLKSHGWPIDAFVVSMYPVNLDANLRGEYVKLVETALARNEAPPRQIWESEANFFAESGKPFPTQTQNNLVARTYISSQEIGVSRTYWFSWEQQISILGIRLTMPAGVPTPAATAYRTIQSWMAGQKWQGCKQQQGVDVCGVGAGNSRIIFRNSGQSRVSAPSGSKQICTLDGKCQQLRAGATVVANQEPKLIKAG